MCCIDTCKHGIEGCEIPKAGQLAAQRGGNGSGRQRATAGDDGGASRPVWRLHRCQFTPSLDYCTIYAAISANPLLSVFVRRPVSASSQRNPICTLRLVAVH